MSSLIEVFDYSFNDAEEMTNNVHEAGSAVVATLSFEMAEQKQAEVTMMAQLSGYPLTVKIKES
jgi:ATP-dependent Clp protease adapter protein ClpS